MTIQSIEAKLKKLDRQREQLSKQLETRKQKQYKAIPAKYGFKSIDALIAALTPYASGSLQSQRPKRGRPPKATGNAKPVATRAAKVGGRKKYTAQHRAAVKAALQKGGRTVPQISKDTGVAEYTIIDWKKSWGLVKKRNKKTAKKK